MNAATAQAMVPIRQWRVQSRAGDFGTPCSSTMLFDTVHSLPFALESGGPRLSGRPGLGIEITWHEAGASGSQLQG